MLILIYGGVAFVRLAKNNVDGTLQVHQGIIGHKTEFDVICGRFLSGDLWNC